MLNEAKISRPRPGLNLPSASVLASRFWPRLTSLELTVYQQVHPTSPTLINEKHHHLCSVNIQPIYRNTWRYNQSN